MNSYISLESIKKEIDFIDDKICEYNELNVPFELSLYAYAGVLNHSISLW